MAKENIDKPEEKIAVSVDELITLAAMDSEFFCRTFFANTVRQPFAPAHRQVWKKFEESPKRLINILMARGFAKTSHARMFTAKRIAYALSRTIFYVSKSEGHAIRSTSWLRKQIEHNALLRDTFLLRPGQKWQDLEFEIIVGHDEIPVWVMASGISGSIRGVNRDDYRPDLIVLDDVLDDENAHTADQREKMNTLVYGALKQSLAPAVENPGARLIALNTPQNVDDFAVQALKDPEWDSLVCGCFTPETADYPTEYQVSAWPERFPSEVLRREKHSAASRNMLSTFLREMECKLISPETAAFRTPWLKKFVVDPEVMSCVYVIDPVPPPSDLELAKGFKDKDFECHAVVAAAGMNRYLLDYRLMRGHEPTWTIKTFFELQQKWHPYKCLVESVNYQRTLEWLLRKAMDANRAWFPVTPFNDKRKKYNRIITGINGVASAGRLFVRDTQIEFLEQYAQYPQVKHDDLLDAVSIALMELEGVFVDNKGMMRSTLDDLTAGSRAPDPLNIFGAP